MLFVTDDITLAIKLWTEFDDKKIKSCIVAVLMFIIAGDTNHEASVLKTFRVVKHFGTVIFGTPFKVY